MRIRRWLLVLAALALIAGACSSDDDDSSGDTTTTEGSEKTTTTEAAGDDSPNPDEVTLEAGHNDPENLRISVNEFLPEKIEVKVGAKVTWELDETELHSVTFLPDGEELPPPTDEAGQEALLVPSEDGDSVDGETLVNSGLQPTSPDYEGFTANFPDAGEFTYYCVIHPRMVGTVTVTEDEAESQADIDERAEGELSTYLREGRDAGNELAAANEPEPARSEPNDKGGTTYYVETGTTTEHTDVLAFAPTDVANLTVNDEIVFINNSEAPHTATFGPASDFPSPSDGGVVQFVQASQQQVPGASPQALTGGTYFNSGWLLPTPAPEAMRQYKYSFDEPGTYNYVCLLHASSNMVGSLEVTAG